MPVESDNSGARSSGGGVRANPFGAKLARRGMLVVSAQISEPELRRFGLAGSIEATMGWTRSEVLHEEPVTVAIGGQSWLHGMFHHHGMLGITPMPRWSSHPAPHAGSVLIVELAPGQHLVVLNCNEPTKDQTPGQLSAVALRSALQRLANWITNTPGAGERPIYLHRPSIAPGPDWPVAEGLVMGELRGVRGTLHSVP